MALPWVRVEKDYVFDTEDGPQHARRAVRRPLPAARLPLHVRPGLGRRAARAARSAADDFDRGIVHLDAARRDVDLRLARAAREAAAYKRRMGWSFPWVSSSERLQLRLRRVVHASEQAGDGAEYNFRPVSGSRATSCPGLSAFVLDDGVVYRTYSAYGRGLDSGRHRLPLLDRAAKGRDEADGDDWIRRRDEYPARELRLAGASSSASRSGTRTSLTGVGIPCRARDDGRRRCARPTPSGGRRGGRT